MNIDDLGLFEFFELLKKNNPYWTNDCYRCTHFNGECKDFAKQGKCRAWNKANIKENKA